MRLLACLSPLTLVFALASCSRAESSSTAQPEPSTTSASKAAPVESPTGRPSQPTGPLVLARGIRFAKPSADSDVAKIVRDERARAAADGRELIVYVGATWCEPCQRFHEAAKRGELDADFPELTILDFDLDEDRERLVTAGYVSKLIPLFVRPGEDGRASDRRFEGGIKGGGAVGNITPRLRKLVEK